MQFKFKLGLICIAIAQLGSLSSIFLAVVGGWDDSSSQIREEEFRELAYQEKTNATKEDLSESIPDKVILMVIDALRVDMITPENFPFLFRHLKKFKNTGVLRFRVDLDSPTVTLPRVKTLLTGKAPTFIDVLKNFQTTETAYTSTTKLNQDNLISSLKREKPDVNICFFGDETWLRLFPSREDGTSEYFHKWEGVTSFYVKDFYQVDQNVTRNLNEIKDCQFLILHYLGLDHIGHVFGPVARPDLITDKLNEMDKVIQKLHHQLVDGSSSKNLLLVTGDHGMANAGGHGGSSFEEVTTPLIAISTGIPSLNQEPVKEGIDQVDIAPTLAALWGLKIPKDSRGQLILDIIEQFQSSQELAMSYQNNCEHLLRVMGESREAATYRLWWNEISKLDKPLSIKKYIELENELVAAIRGVKSERNLWSSFLSGIIILVITEMILLTCIANNFSKSWKGTKPAVALIILPPLFIYFSSSLIEEEHYIRYFLYSASLFGYCIFARPIDFKSIQIVCKILFIHRLAMSFNQTGDKWSHLPDLNDSIVKHNLSWATAAFGTILIYYYAKFSNTLCKIFSISLVSIFVIEIVSSLGNEIRGTVIFKFIADHHLQQLGYVLIFLNFILNIYNKKKLKTAIFSTFLLISLLLQRLQNFILPGLILMQTVEINILLEHQQLLKTDLKKSGKLRISLLSQVIYVWLAKASFFYQGNSNGLATIDVSAGYVGFGSFSSSFLIGLLIFINTFSSPLLVYISSLVCYRQNSNFYKNQQNGVFDKNSKVKKKLHSNPSNPLLFMCLLSIGAEAIVYAFVLIVFQNHLFIWSVFVPKLIYLIAQSVMYLFLCILSLVII